jgi:hypothetical protein
MRSGARCSGEHLDTAALAVGLELAQGPCPTAVAYTGPRTGLPAVSCPGHPTGEALRRSHSPRQGPALSLTGRPRSKRSLSPARCSSHACRCSPIRSALSSSPTSSTSRPRPCSKYLPALTTILRTTSTNHPGMPDRSRCPTPVRTALPLQKRGPYTVGIRGWRCPGRACGGYPSRRRSSGVRPARATVPGCSVQPVNAGSTSSPMPTHSRSIPPATALLVGAIDDRTAMRRHRCLARPERPRGGFAGRPGGRGSDDAASPSVVDQGLSAGVPTAPPTSCRRSNAPK